MARKGKSVLDVISEITGYENLSLYSNSSYINEWEDWYTGKVDSFHNYSIFNGRNYVAQTRFTLGMAKKVCEDWANLLINEKTDITLDNQEARDKMEKIFERCHFWRKANEGIEKTFAIGMGALVVSVENLGATERGEPVRGNARVRVSFVNGEKIIPLAIEDGEIVECAFVNQDTKNTFISIHKRDDTGIYHIINVKAEGIDDSVNWTQEDLYDFNTGSADPWFTVMKPNISNNIDINSALGISIFANAIDILKEIDLIYDSMANEFSLGKKRIFVNARQTSFSTANGETSDVFDTNDVAFYVLPEADDDSNVFIQSDTQELRVTAHVDALQQQLNYLSYACGFGTNHYKFNGSSVATATQVISDNSEMFRTLRKHEIMVEECLIAVAKAIVSASTFTLDPIVCDLDNIQIKFDDSIIEDKEAEKENDRADVSMGVMSKAEYRAKWYNEDLETAARKVDELDSMSISDNIDSFVRRRTDETADTDEDEEEAVGEAV